MENEKFIPMNKCSKKKQKASNAQNRTIVKFNTGTRIMQSPRHRSRAQEKDAIRKGKEI